MMVFNKYDFPVPAAPVKNTLRLYFVQASMISCWCLSIEVERLEITLHRSEIWDFCEDFLEGVVDSWLETVSMSLDCT